MKPTVRQWLFWSPRVLCVLFAAFISLFALDVFGEGRGIGETLLALLIHLIPTALVLVILAISWRREWVGGIVYIGLGILYIVTMWKRPFPWPVYAAISGPLFIVGILFLLNWRCRNQLRPGSGMQVAPPGSQQAI